MTLEQRDPGQALAAIVPASQPLAEVNLFGAKLGDTFDRRFDHARLHRLGASTSPDGREQETAS
ncbi:hypothetical protein ACHGLA_36530 [Streptomyces sp. YH02]|uniref:hypothetical protein n=1 Tax=Streptomyces sp. YH02 TaxID=3256999 RepID=UPI0037572090